MRIAVRAPCGSLHIMPPAYDALKGLARPKTEQGTEPVDDA